ncbi:PAS domain-containing protein [Streptomyces albidoflavus]
MSSRSPVSPAVEPSVRGSVRALIDGTRRVRGALDAVRQGAEGGEPDPPRRRALYELALRQLDDVGGHLGRLSEGWPGAEQPAAPVGEATEGSAEWDLLTDEVCWSPELYRVLGREAGSRALSLDELPSLLLPEDQPLLTAMVTDCLIDGRPLDGAFRVVRGDGTVRTLHMNGAPVLDEHGSTASLRAVLRDVTAAGTPAGRTGAATPPPPAAAAPAARTTTAVRHLPPGPDAAADGTWCDTLTLPDGRTLLAVGDRPPGLSRDLLVGTVRGLVAGGEAPQDALELAAALLPGADPVGPALCCVHDPVTGALDWGRTEGHPAPLLRHGSVALPLDHGGPEERLLPGDLLLLHTTGTGHDSSTELLLALSLRLGGHLDADACADLAADALATTAGGPSGGGQRAAARVIAVRVGSGAGQAGHG